MRKAITTTLVLIIFMLSVFSYFQKEKLENGEVNATELTHEIGDLKNMSDSLQDLMDAYRIKSQKNEALARQMAMEAEAEEAEARNQIEELRQRLIQLQNRASKQPNNPNNQAELEAIRKQLALMDYQRDSLEAANAKTAANSYSALAYRYLETDPNLAFRLAEYAHQMDEENVLSKNVMVTSFYNGPWNESVSGEFSKDGRVYVGSSGTTNQYQLTDLIQLQTRELDEDQSYEEDLMLSAAKRPLLFSPSGQHFVIRHVETVKDMLSYNAHVFNVLGEEVFAEQFDEWPSAEFSENGRFLMISGKLYDLEGGESLDLAESMKKFSQVKAVRFTPNSDLMALTSNKLKIFDLPNADEQLALVCRGEMKIKGNFYVNVSSPFDTEALEERIKFSEDGKRIAVLNGPSINDQNLYYVDVFFLDQCSITSIGDSYPFKPTMHFTQDGSNLLVYDEGTIDKTKSAIRGYRLNDIGNHAELFSPTYIYNQDQIAHFKAEINQQERYEQPVQLVRNEEDIMHLVNDKEIFGNVKYYQPAYFQQLLEAEQSTLAVASK